MTTCSHPGMISRLSSIRIAVTGAIFLALSAAAVGEDWPEFRGPLDIWREIRLRHLRPTPKTSRPSTAAPILAALAILLLPLVAYGGAYFGLC